MVQIKNRIREIDRQLADEINTIRASLKAAYELSLAQENEMRARIDELRLEVLDLQQRSIQYNSIKREVDISRELYRSLLQRLKEVDVAGGSGANNVFIVDKAVTPGAPSSPRMSRALLMAFMLGFGVSLGAAFVLDKLDDRIFTAEELEQISGLPILGVVSRVEEDKNRRRGSVRPAI